MTAKKKSAGKPRKSRIDATLPKSPTRHHASRSQQKAQLRKKIVESALKLFQRNGYEATTTKSIARHAGIAEGTIFNYFRSKEEIAFYFFDQEVDHAIAAVKVNRRLAHAPLEEKLFALVQNQLEFLAPHERFIGAAFVSSLRPGSPLAFSSQAFAIRSKYLSFVQELIQESNPRKHTNPMDWWAAQAFWIYYIGVLLYWLNDPSPGKQHTLAFLDRSLAIGVSFLREEKR
jgi:AcrR family transcriptional regulator